MPCTRGRRTHRPSVEPWCGNRNLPPTVVPSSPAKAPLVRSLDVHQGRPERLSEHGAGTMTAFVLSTADRLGPTA